MDSYQRKGDYKSISDQTVTNHHAAAAAKSRQSCPTLCNPIDGSPPGSPVPGILQARTLEWAAISFSNAWKGKVKVKSLSHVQFFVTPWTAAYWAPLPMGFSRQESWSGVPLPSLYKPSYLPLVLLKSHLPFLKIIYSPLRDLNPPAPFPIKMIFNPEF